MVSGMGQIMHRSGQYQSAFRTQNGVSGRRQRSLWCAPKMQIANEQLGSSPVCVWNVKYLPWRSRGVLNLPDSYEHLSSTSSDCRRDVRPKPRSTLSARQIRAKVSPLLEDKHLRGCSSGEGATADYRRRFSRLRLGTQPSGYFEIYDISP